MVNAVLVPPDAVVGHTTARCRWPYDRAACDSSPSKQCMRARRSGAARRQCPLSRLPTAASRKEVNLGTECLRRSVFRCMCDYQLIRRLLVDRPGLPTPVLSGRDSFATLPEAPSETNLSSLWHDDVLTIVRNSDGPFPSQRPASDASTGQSTDIIVAYKLMSTHRSSRLL